MASFVQTVETLTITISSTNTSATGSTTLGQTAADCSLWVTIKTPRTTDENYGPRLIKADISGSTVTIRRGTGTDIGTITAIVTVVEHTTDCVVSTADTSITGGTTSNTASVSITDIDRAFMVFSQSTTYAPGDTTVATHPLCRGVITDTSTLTFTRAQSTNSITCRWYLVECINDEFSVQRGTITVANSVEDASTSITSVDMDLTFTIFSLTSANSDDWVNVVGRCYLGSATTVDFSRANGGAAATFSLTVAFQAITMTGGTVQRGDHAITATSASTNITAVDLDFALPWCPGLLGMGEGDSTDGDDVGQFWAAVEMVDTDTVQSSVVTDSTAGQWSWEVIEFEAPAAGNVDGAFSGAGAGSGVIAVAGIKLKPGITGAGAGSGAIAAAGTKLRVAISGAAAGSGTIAAKLKPNDMAAAGAGSGVIAVTGIKLRVGISGGGAGAAGIAEAGVKLRVTVVGAGAGSGVNNAALVGVIELLVLETESTVVAVLTMEEYMSVLGIWNGALARLGQSPVTDAPASDGTPTGDLLAANWPEFKEQFLRKTAWDGGKRTKQLVTFKHSDGVTPVAPVSPNRWTHAYALPADHVRSLRLNGRENMPGQKSLGGLGLWEEEVAENDVGTLKRCVFANDEPAMLEYIFLVPDANITLLPADMRRAMAKEFAVEVAPFFGKTESDLLVLEAHAAKIVAEAKRSDDQTGSKPTFIDNTMERSFW